MEKPFSQACENNKVAILQIIRTVYAETPTVWEIGSGTGQHACYFARHLPHLHWQATDRPENLAGIDSWIREARLDNLPFALALDVSDQHWPCQRIEALFSANTLHIMHWREVERLFAGLREYLHGNAPVCLYGPFNYHGRYTSISNERFDQWLKVRNPGSGIRDIDDIELLAKASGLHLAQDFAMPANNRLLVLRKY
ncbi:DUF938 domain-containing protein [Methylomarinum sp. Ch1-1]|uniref:DUF938 domain-containing protein n=1 Tax=Methylomarinum roseum TaxID=3067653 RepID=A0AAU7NS00_9GAMM|nr:DUF938 domain-containing protein [Methylomarinum sp. Ch1-1]MDP4520260.1 DUF938 domain-containing protein [Methylomarinum sp. Ch1-1]